MIASERKYFRRLATVIAQGGIAPTTQRLMSKGSAGVSSKAVSLARFMNQSHPQEDWLPRNSDAQSTTISDMRTVAK